MSDIMSCMYRNKIKIRYERSKIHEIVKLCIKDKDFI